MARKEDYPTFNEIISCYPVRLTNQTMKNIKLWPLAQKRTSHWKAYTYMGPRFVAKGPYSLTNEGSRRRLETTWNRFLEHLRLDVPTLHPYFIREEANPDTIWVLYNQLSPKHPRHWIIEERSSFSVGSSKYMSELDWKRNVHLVGQMLANSVISINQGTGDCGMWNQLFVYNDHNQSISGWRSFDLPFDPNSDGRWSSPADTNLEFARLVQVDFEEKRGPMDWQAIDDWWKLVSPRPIRKEIRRGLEEVIKSHPDLLKPLWALEAKLNNPAVTKFVTLLEQL